MVSFSPNPQFCPPNIVESLERFRDDGVPTGDFLTAVLENDLMEAILRADHDNMLALPHICAWVYEYLPRNIYGCRELIHKHFTSKKNARESSSNPESYQPRTPVG